jgi:hypothetical protein
MTGLRDMKRGEAGLGANFSDAGFMGSRNATFVVARADGLTDEPRERICPSLLVI